MPTQPQFEKRIQSFFERVGKVQKQLPTLRRVGLARALKGEIVVREVLSDVFDDGLSLLGKGIVLGRKQTERFIAKTHKKTNELLKLSQQLKDKAIKTQPVKPKHSSIRKHSARKSRLHAAPVSQQH